MRCQIPGNINIGLEQTKVQTTGTNIQYVPKVTTFYDILNAPYGLKIEKGMLADFVVLPENPAIIGVEKIKDLKILKTFVGGELVYNSGGN